MITLNDNLMTQHHTLRLTSLPAVLLLVLLGAFHVTTSYAQENLLQNPGFNRAGEYVDQRRAGSDVAFALAPGWSGWYTNSPRTASWMNVDPIGYPTTLSPKYEGEASQDIGRGGGTFTAAAYQTVNNIPEGTTLRASAWVYQEVGSPNGAQTRIGIGSNVNGNPLADSIKWSSWLTAINSWQRISIEATVPAGSVTLFLYSTQSAPSDPNDVYYDAAELVVVGEGEVDVEEGNDGDSVQPPPPPTSTPFQYVPFVQQQGADESGRVVHTVRSGDTLSSIAVAYNTTRSRIEELNNLDSTILREGQQLLIREAPPATATPAATTTPTPQPTTADTAANAAGSGGFASPTPLSVAQGNTGAEDAAADEATTAPTDAPTSTPTTPPTATHTPTTPPTATPTATFTPQPPPAVCVSVYADENENNIRDNEPLLAGATIVLQPTGSSDPVEYVTDGTSEPRCFESLANDTYTVRATAPDGYYIPRSSVGIDFQAGQRYEIDFAAVEGEAVALAATPYDQTADSATIVEEDPVGDLRNIAGLLVLAAAGVILLGGTGLAFYFSRQ